MNSDRSRANSNQQQLAIDSVLTTQPELGPSIPDGGYGWVVFLATLFFQALIPTLSSSFGIFLAFSRLQSITESDVNPKLWDDSFMYAPLFFTASWTIFDPISRTIISTSTWPRLVGTSGICLTCAGLLFLWMGLTEHGGLVLFLFGGIAAGVGASIQIAQCEILLGQYFRLKHSILVNVSHAVTSVGFILTPIALGYNILRSDLLHVVLWYQAIMLQGLILNLLFKKPAYLKSKYRDTYNYISPNPDDEEDIFSKNSRELQIKRQNSTGSRVTIEKHQIPQSKETNTSSSTEPSSSGVDQNRRNWEIFEEDDENKETKNTYEINKEDWETFEDDDEDEVPKPKPKNWVKFEDERKNEKNLQLELSFADEGRMAEGPTTNISGRPMPLFADLPVNHNNTYSYDALEQEVIPAQQPGVFMPTTIERNSMISRLDILKQPSFYKSLLTILTTKFSLFIYYTLFPLYVYEELQGTTMRYMSGLVAYINFSNLFFTSASYYINVNKKKRPIWFWILCWIGALGYFMLSDSKSENFLIFGAIQVVVSIYAMQYIGTPLMGLTIRGETNKEYGLISVMTGIAFVFFLIIDATFKNCFKLMALLHFFTGAVWFSNYIYKKIKL